MEKKDSMGVDIGMEDMDMDIDMDMEGMDMEDVDMGEEIQEEKKSGNGRSNLSLRRAFQKKNDEFYTRYEDIDKQVSYFFDYDPDVFRDKVVLCPCDDPTWSNFTRYFVKNFDRLGLKRLVSTCIGSRGFFSIEAGKKLVLDRKDIRAGVDMDNLPWEYLGGYGDFREGEVSALCDACDIVVTNPPFSLFRSFFKWIKDRGKKFLVVSHLTGCSYSRVFPYIQRGEVWLGACVGLKKFYTPDGMGMGMGNCIWLTNLRHTWLPPPLELMSMEDNLKYSRHAIIRERGYEKYDNYDAIEVPYCDAIPFDYEGIMGVPISFLTKWSPFAGAYDVRGKFTGDARNQTVGGGGYEYCTCGYLSKKKKELMGGGTNCGVLFTPPPFGAV